MTFGTPLPTLSCGSPTSANPSSLSFIHTLSFILSIHSSGYLSTRHASFTTYPLHLTPLTTFSDSLLLHSTPTPALLVACTARLTSSLSVSLSLSFSVVRVSWYAYPHPLISCSRARFNLSPVPWFVLLIDEKCTAFVLRSAFSGLSPDCRPRNTVEEAG